MTEIIGRGKNVPDTDKNMNTKDELVAEWKRYLESDEFLHSPECGTLLIARHFAEWGRRHNEQKEDKEND